jgi:hypothetical protein
VALGMKEDSDQPRGPSTKSAMSMIIEPVLNAYAITDNEGRDRAGGRAAGDGRENLPEESMVIAPEFLLLDMIRGDKSPPPGGTRPKRIENQKAVFAFDRITLGAFGAIVERYRCRDVGNFVALLRSIKRERRSIGDFLIASTRPGRGLCNGRRRTRHRFFLFPKITFQLSL